MRFIRNLLDSIEHTCYNEACVISQDIPILREYPKPEASMRSFFQFLTYFDWLALPRTIAQTFAHADWRAARDSHGVSGVLMEAGASLIGSNTFPFFVPLGTPWGGREIQALLGSKGIKLWGLGYANGEAFFRVSRNQAVWAQYLMLRAGVPLLHRLLAEEPPGNRIQSRSVDEQPTEQSSRPRKAIDHFEKLMDSIESFLP
jgi:hypothetical protein